MCTVNNPICPEEKTNKDEIKVNIFSHYNSSKGHFPVKIRLSRCALIYLELMNSTCDITGH